MVGKGFKGLTSGGFPPFKEGVFPQGKKGPLGEFFWGPLGRIFGTVGVQKLGSPFGRGVEVFFQLTLTGFFLLEEGTFGEACGRRGLKFPPLLLAKTP